MDTNPTLDPYGGWSSAGIGDSTVNNQSADWSAGSVLPGAGDWGDVLKFGFSRLVDAKVRSVQPENAAPVLQKTAPATTSSPAAVKGEGSSPLSSKTMVLVVGGLAALGLVLWAVRR